MGFINKTKNIDMPKNILSPIYMFSLTLWKLFHLELHISYSHVGDWANSCWWFCQEKWPNMRGDRGRSLCLGVENLQAHKPGHKGWTLCPAAPVNTYELGRYDMMEVTEGDMVSIETPQEMFVDDEPKATTEVNDRWANVDPRQLDELAKNSTSKYTQNQTEWALQISCVKFVTDFPSVYDSCQILFLFCNLADPGTWLATGLLIGEKPGQQVATRSKTPTI